MCRGAAVVVSLLVALTLVPAAASGQEPAIERVAGADRYETAAAVVERTHPDRAATVYVATGEDFPDGLAAGPAAAAAGAPLLLTARERLPAATAAALDRLEPDEVRLLGGTGAIDEFVAAEITERTGANVGRLAGRTRLETAAAIAGEFDPGVAVAYVARADAFPDALAAAAVAGVTGGPVLLTGTETLPPVTAAALTALAPEAITVLGGTAAVSDDVLDALADLTEGPVERLSGPDRYATAVAVAQAAFDAADVAYLASGTDFPDALVGGLAAAGEGAPLLLTGRACLPEVVHDELARRAVSRVVLLGGEAAVGVGPERLLACGRETSVVASGLAIPWDVAFTPDERVFVTERDSGNLVELVDGEPEVVQTFDVNPEGEGGLLGLTASPDYDDDGLLYAYLTTATDNRVVRFEAGQTPEVVLDGIPRASVHNGGRIAFGPDGLLYVTTGDAGNPARSQDRDDLAGKILRVTPDGQVPADNPFDSPVFAYGIRNAQGLAWDGSGTLIVTEFGPAVDDAVLRVAPGTDQGWGSAAIHVAGARDFPDAVVVKQPSVASWSGAAVLAGGSIPAWEGDLFVAALRGERLWRFELGPDGGLAGEEALFVGELGRLRHVARSPDGALWLLTSNRDGRGDPVADDDRIIRIGPPR